MIEAFFFIILLIFLLILLIVLNFLFKFDWFEPSITITFAMFLSVFLAYVNMYRWVYNISFVTFLSISLGYISFSLGSIYVFYILFYKTKQKNFVYKYKTKFFDNNILLLIVSLIMLLLMYFSFKDVYNLSLSLGNKDSISGMIKTVRYALEQHQIYSLGRWMTYRLLIAQTLAYTYIYMFFYKSFFDKFKIIDIKFLVPGILFFPFMIFTTGRMELMKFFIFVTVIIAILYKRKYGNFFNKNIKLNFLLIIFATIFISLFFAFGNFTGKVITKNHSPFVILSHYGGLSVPALDVVLNQTFIEDKYIGQNTLVNVYRVIEKFGVTLPKVEYFLPFVHFEGIDTNVYTALGRYIKDFGYLGMMVIMFMLAIIYTFFYHKSINEKGHIITLLYATLSFPLFLSSIDERFLLDIFGMPLVYDIVLFYVADKFIIRQYIKQKINHKVIETI